MKVLILDVETTTHAKGNAFSRRNKLVVVGVKWWGSNESQHFYDDFSGVQKYLDEADYIAGVNIKFDIHWCMNVGLVMPDKLKIWELQLFEFCRLAQREKRISLNFLCEQYGLGEQKLDFIKENYWDEGIDTDQIPREELSRYLDQDLHLTEQVFDWQWKNRNQGWFRAFRTDCLDMWNAIEMERNGTKIDVQGFRDEEQAQLARKAAIVQRLSDLCPAMPINFGSGDHLSVLLFGGEIEEERRLPIGVFKTGAKIGQPRYKVVKIVHTFERMFEPVPRSELKKVGYFSTKEEILRKIKTGKRKAWIVEDLIELAKIDKLVSSYLAKFPKMVEDMAWPDGMIHGQFKHGVVVTGRMASANPNLQNIPAACKSFIVTRYDTVA